MLPCVRQDFFLAWKISNIYVEELDHISVLFYLSLREFGISGFNHYVFDGLQIIDHFTVINIEALFDFFDIQYLPANM